MKKTVLAASLLAMNIPCFSAYGQEAQSTMIFRITPLKPVAQLMEQARKERPPESGPGLRQPELVDLAALSPDFRFDVRYSTDRNFLGVPVYVSSHAFLEKPAAEALSRVLAFLKTKGYGLLIFDAYRPWFITKVFWDATPADKHLYVANPQTGSRHNRGCAVDLTLYDLKTGAQIEMPSGFDEMTERAHSDYVGATDQQKAARQLLKDAMQNEGFTQLPAEWWHFDYKDWALYPIQNIPFEEL
ncbi:MAG: M15 family metallopeptidase [Acetobacter indonesiensis]